MVTALALIGLAVLLLGPVPHYLLSARWALAEPRAALVLWQSVALAGGLAVLGAALAVALIPLHRTLFDGLGTIAGRLAEGDPTGGLGPVHTVLLLLAVMLGARLLGVLTLSGLRTLRARRRHRQLVALIGRPLTAELAARHAVPDASDGLMLDHPAPVAYCLPGAAPRLVLSSGALRLFDDEELTAILAHERAHLAERHDLVVLPFAAWSAALPWLPTVRRSRGAVDALVEMVADDRACADCDRTVLACALARFGASGVPAGALGADAGELTTRVRRLLDPPSRSPRLRIGLYAAAALLLSVPTLALLVAGA